MSRPIRPARIPSASPTSHLIFSLLRGPQSGIILRLILGATIGVERQWRQRMAGLRTNALVATGAALFVMLGSMIAGESSPTRVVSYVVSGIGFLGGG